LTIQKILIDSVEDEASSLATPSRKEMNNSREEVKGSTNIDSAITSVQEAEDSVNFEALPFATSPSADPNKDTDEGAYDSLEVDSTTLHHSGTKESANSETFTSDSLSGINTNPTTVEIYNSPNSTPSPPTFADIDRWNYHTDLQTFGKNLQPAINAVFPNENRSWYSKVSVLMMSWEDEDPQLPVSLELDELEQVFRLSYHFHTEKWEIPETNCHYKVDEKVIGFVKPEEDSGTHLKIVYYAGHASACLDKVDITFKEFLVVTTNANMHRSNWRNKAITRCPIVKRGAIQSFLEEAPNHALILLDCCASGTANTSEGTGVTELISACAWNQVANGVGSYSLTNALIIELQLLAKKGTSVLVSFMKTSSLGFRTGYHKL
jgi:hypothetical protein